MALEITKEGDRIRIEDTDDSDASSSYLASRIEIFRESDIIRFEHVDRGVIIKEVYSNVTLVGVSPAPTSASDMYDRLLETYLAPPSVPESPVSAGYDEGTFDELSWDSITTIAGAPPTNAAQATIIVNGSATGTLDILGFFQIDGTQPSPLSTEGMPVYEGQVIYLKTRDQIDNFWIRGEEAGKTHTFRIHYWFITEILK